MSLAQDDATLRQAMSELVIYVRDQTETIRAQTSKISRLEDALEQLLAPPGHHERVKEHIKLTTTQAVAARYDEVINSQADRITRLELLLEKLSHRLAAVASPSSTAPHITVASVTVVPSPAAVVPHITVESPTTTAPLATSSTAKADGVTSEATPKPKLPPATKKTSKSSDVLSPSSPPDPVVSHRRVTRSSVRGGGRVLIPGPGTETKDMTLDPFKTAKASIRADNERAKRKSQREEGEDDGYEL